MPALRWDPEYEAATAAFRSGPKPPAAKTALDLRQLYNSVIPAVMSTLPASPNVKTTVFKVKSYDGAEVEITRFASETALNSSVPTPATIYGHGGGMVACSVESFAPQLAQRASLSDVPIFAVHYRLAPEHPAPAGIEDFYAALTYVSQHAAELNVDPARIAVQGDSAGAGIAASVALVARDRNFQPPLAKQILAYPMLDDRTDLAPDSPLNEFLGWTPSDGVIAWNAYIGEDKRGKPDTDIPGHAVPARAKSLRGLPPTYIDVGTLDLFREESMEYAMRLMRDDVEVEFHLYPGVPHGFDAVQSTSVAKRALELRIAAMRTIGV